MFFSEGVFVKKWMSFTVKGNGRCRGGPTGPTGSTGSTLTAREKWCHQCFVPLTTRKYSLTLNNCVCYFCSSGCRSFHQTNDCWCGATDPKREDIIVVENQKYCLTEGCAYACFNSENISCSLCLKKGRPGFLHMETPLCWCRDCVDRVLLSSHPDSGERMLGQANRDAFDQEQNAVVASIATSVLPMFLIPDLVRMCVEFVSCGL
jgi:hypothetical protein